MSWVPRAALLAIALAATAARAADPELRRNRAPASAPSVAAPQPSAQDEEPEESPAPPAPPVPPPAPSIAAATPPAAPAPPAALVLTGHWRWDDGTISAPLTVDRQDADGSFHGSLETSNRPRVDGKVEGDAVTLTLRSKVLFVTLATRAQGKLTSRAPAHVEGSWKGVRSSGRFTMEKMP